MSLADIAVLTVVAFVLAASLVVARWRLRRVDREIRAYGLYAVRDELVQLVAEKRLSEDNMIFTTFYGTCHEEHEAGQSIPEAPRSGSGAHRRYQPSKAELEADVSVDATPEQVARCLVQDVEVREIKKPR